MISIICPCRNEELYIEQFLLLILESDYPQDQLDILIIDGMSEDKTRDIIQKYIKQNQNIKLLDNPNKTTPYALNRGIKNATGDIIIRLDVHSIYPKDYITKLVYYLDKTQADNVGGVWEVLPANNSIQAKSIAVALSSKFGIGNSAYRNAKNKEYYEVDTVPYGCYRKEIFEKIGLFDIELIRNQDNELNARMRQKGGKIYLIPSIKIGYYARKNYKDLFKMFWGYGYYGPLVDLKLSKLSKLSKYVPLLFVSSILFSGFLSIFIPVMAFVLFFIMGLYISVGLLFAIKDKGKKNSFITVPFIMWGFLVSHISYGAGYLKGIIDFIILGKIKTRIQ